MTITNIQLLTSVGVAGSALPIGPAGPQGPAGPPGPSGPISAVDLSSIAASFRGNLAGLRLSNDAVTPNNIVDVASGIACDSTAAMMMPLPAGGTVDLTATGVGGLDTGAVTASSWYALFVIGGSAGIGLIASKSAAGVTPAPALPVGYSFSRYIGSVKTDGSSHVISFQQFGTYFYWQAAIRDLNASTAGSPTLFTITVPLGVNVMPIFVFTSSSGGAWSPLMGSALPLFASASLFSAPSLTTNTSAQLYYQATNFTFITLGWIDPRCADAN